MESAVGAVLHAEFTVGVRYADRLAVRYGVGYVYPVNQGRDRIGLCDLGNGALVIPIRPAVAHIGYLCNRQLSAVPDLDSGDCNQIGINHA